MNSDNRVIKGVSDDGGFFPVQKLQAHIDGTFHEAVSVFLFCEGKMLIQQRAADKYHSGSLWANTCCSHPDWEETRDVCAVRRLGEELGIVSPELDYCGTVDYREDVNSGLIENERAHIFIGSLLSLTPDMSLDPNEVQEVRWITKQELFTELGECKQKYSAWFSHYISSGNSVIQNALLRGAFV